VVNLTTMLAHASGEWMLPTGLYVLLPKPQIPSAWAPR